MKLDPATIIDNLLNATEADDETPLECKVESQEPVEYPSRKFQKIPRAWEIRTWPEKVEKPIPSKVWRCERKRETAIIPNSIARTSTVRSTEDLEAKNGQTNLDLGFLPFDTPGHGFLEIYDLSGDTLKPINRFSLNNSDKILFNELLSMPLAKIPSSPVAIELPPVVRTMNDFKEVLFFDTPFNPSYHKAAILKAVNDLASRWVLCPDGLAINAVVANRWNFSADNENEPLVELRRQLPPGNHRGPLIHLLTARRYLARKARQFRAYCIFAVEWNQCLTKNGRPIPIMTKKYMHPKSGRILRPDAGELRKIQSTGTILIPMPEINPDVLHLPPICDPYTYFYTPEEIIQNLTILPGQTKKERNRVYQRRSKARRRAKKWLDEMEQDRAISRIRGRILPGRNLRLYWPSLPSNRRR